MFQSNKRSSSITTCNPHQPNKMPKLIEIEDNEFIVITKEDLDEALSNINGEASTSTIAEDHADNSEVSPSSESESEEEECNPKKLMCSLCKKYPTTRDQLKIHFESPSHAKKVTDAKVNKNLQCCFCPKEYDNARDFHAHICKHLRIKNTIKPLEKELLGKDITHCDECEMALTSRENALAHYKGKKHFLTTMEKNTNSNDSIIKTIVRLSELQTESIPRPYQTELYNKIMNSKKSTICYLPTGTGKTLVAIMVIQAMLKNNPNRWAFFFTDRVLLLLQQCSYIRDQLGGTYKIAAFAGEKYTDTNGEGDIKDCSILIFTAARFENLLNQEALQWMQASIVVFDEVHHCDKRHVYHRLLENYQKKVTSKNKPKLLGLTPSPTDKANYSEAESVLKNRLSEFDGAELVAVTKNTADLEKYDSNAKVQLETIPVHKSIQNILNKVNAAASTYYQLGVANNLILDKRFKELLELLCNDSENWEGVSIQLSKMPADDLDQKSKVFFGFFRELISSTTMLPILNLRDSIDCFEKLIKLKNNIPLLQRHHHLEDILTDLKNIDASAMTNTIYEKMIELTLLMLREYKELNKLLFTLVVTRTRANVVFLQEKLAQETRLTGEGIEVNHLTGHGSSKSTKVKGMKVTEQKSALKKANKKKNQLFVATSVIEEGIDIPSCGLVIALDPPANGTAFVQLRGRARQDDSQFYLLLANDKTKDILTKLLKCENNMKNIVKSICK